MDAISTLRDLGVSSFDGLNPGAYYGSAVDLSLGAGLLYAGVQYAVFQPTERQFAIVEGLALILSNECDVANERAFNDSVLACPIITLEQFADQFIDEHGIGRAANIIKSIAGNDVYRVFYLPPPSTLFPIPGMRNGGMMYLNHICSVHVSLLSEPNVRPVGALSEYAQMRLDLKLQNHLLRPKEESLPQTR